VKSFKSKLLCKIVLEVYSLDMLYNGDETDLWWKLMPSRSIVIHKAMPAKIFKKAKDRVTLLDSDNVSGTYI